jgi:hypothetical protein
MENTLTIPEKNYNTYFGDVKKVVWFEVTDNPNYFQINFRIQRLQTKNVSIRLGNLDSQYSSLWSKVYPLSSNPQIVEDQLKISHVPTQNSTTYGVFNV